VSVTLAQPSTVFGTQEHFKDLLRALTSLDLVDDVKRIVASSDGGEDTVIREIIDGRRLPQPISDLFEYGRIVRTLRQAQIAAAPRVEAMTPWLRAPWQRFVTKHPVRGYIRGEIDDVLKISERETSYLAMLDLYTPGNIVLGELDDDTLFEGLSRLESLDTLLRRTRDVNRWIGTLHGLVKSGFVVWLSPA